MSLFSPLALSFYTQRTLCLVQNIRLYQEKYIIALLLLLQLEILNQDKIKTVTVKHHDGDFNSMTCDCVRFYLFISQAENWTVLYKVRGSVLQTVCALIRVLERAVH